MYHVRKSYLENEIRIKQVKIKQTQDEKKKAQDEIDELDEKKQKQDESPNINILKVGYHKMQLALLEPKV